jgi:hypothetical protein
MMRSLVVWDIPPRGNARISHETKKGINYCLWLCAVLIWGACYWLGGALNCQVKKNLPRAHHRSGPRVMPLALTPVSPRPGWDAGVAHPWASYRRQQPWRSAAHPSVTTNHLRTSLEVDFHSPTHWHASYAQPAAFWRSPPLPLGKEQLATRQTTALFTLCHEAFWPGNYADLAAKATAVDSGPCAPAKFWTYLVSWPSWRSCGDRKALRVASVNLNSLALEWENHPGRLVRFRFLI